MLLYSKLLSIILLLSFPMITFGQSEWYVAPSDGASFGKFTRWSKDFGRSSDILLIADVTGDGKDDAIVVFAR